MPPINPPNPLQEKTYVITSTDLLNAIVLQVDNFHLLSGQLISDSNYDGTLEIDILDNDGVTWNLSEQLSNPSQLLNTGNQFLIGGSSDTVKYPYSIRVKITTKATQGTCSIDVNYL